MYNLNVLTSWRTYGRLPFENVIYYKWIFFLFYTYTVKQITEVSLLIWFWFFSEEKTRQRSFQYPIFSLHFIEIEIWTNIIWNTIAKEQRWLILWSSHLINERILLFLMHKANYNLPLCENWKPNTNTMLPNDYIL